MDKHTPKINFERSRSKKQRLNRESCSTGLYYRQNQKFGRNTNRKQRTRRSPSNSYSSSRADSRSPHGSPLESHYPQFNGPNEVEHITLRRGDILNEKYRVLKILGDGTFGRVVECEYRGLPFAVKIIKPVDRYIESAKIERSIIKKINQSDPEDREGIVRYKESFYYREHFCMVFKPLGKSLYQFLVLNSFKGFPIKTVQNFFKQILRSVGFLHKIGYTHTDLKPENILLEYNEYKQVETEGGQKPYYLPCSQKIRIIDFGGATRHDQYHSSTINTRQYRSPEVILQCCQWDEISDIWSIGCIVVELLTGRQMFPTKENREHLAMIQKNCGRYPGWMIHKIPRQQPLKRLFLDGLVDQDSVPTLKFVIQLPMLEQLIPGQPELVHLLRECLEIDPNKRINCRQALKHPFFQISF